MPVTINGDGLIEVGGTSTTQGRVRLAEDTDNGSNYVELTAPASVTANRTVTFPDANVDFSAGLGVAQGGTGATSLTANNVLLGNGTSAVQVVAPGASGNLLTSNGTTWTSAAPASSFVGFRGQAFTSNGTFTIPTGITAVKVTVVGGGGGSGGASNPGCCAPPFRSAGGGSGGAAISFLTGLTPGNTLSVTIGSGGSAGGVGGAGGSGGNSSVASGTQSISTITANGGSGTAAGSGSTLSGGAGGTASGGTINMTGQGGAATNRDAPGNGGSSILGGGGRGINGGAGVAGGAYGGGAGGAASNSAAGGAGGAGVVIFEW